ncbi:DUF2806 domain-containing protein [Pseudodesulfovibrio indicus]|uniref:Uncharacterized protein DUF2806 n=1 Tax=Pseudodesulfovibrio indicus TaxID=1716143 RepID=A0AA94PKH6_9BACT|nr:DUF2806 domain-containing protein [Pseudodesulfovibrio indicus]TDT82038.1 uncharacterized protein DUF2806 [Pseudodesulfovibrio indicus]
MGEENIGLPVKISVEADLTKSCEQLAEATPKGCRKIAHLLWGKRDANVTRHKALTLAQTKMDVEKVLAGRLEYRDGELVQAGACSKTIGSEYWQRAIEQGVGNVAGNVRVAIQALADIPNDQVSDEDVAPDWFARWRREAEVVGDEDIQRLWGRLLAEEVKKPKSISYRTLDVLKNISISEANLFMKIAPFVIFGILPCNPANNEYPDNITTNDIIVLNNAGLIHQSTFGVRRSSGLKGVADGEDFTFVECGEVVFCEFLRSDEISISGLVLTDAGEQILKICDAKWFSVDSAGILWGHVQSYINPKKGFFRVYKMDRDRNIGEPVCEVDRS